jgi:nitronate monooxygenase
MAGRDHRDPGGLGQGHPDKPAAPFAINQIVHKSNDRLEHDMAGVRQVQGADRHHQPGRARGREPGRARWGGVVLHDIINNKFAHKAIEKGADGLIAVAAGAGGHAGVKSPFALMQEIRQWFDGPLALSGSIASGDAMLAAQAMGADFAYIGSAFIATTRRAPPRPTSRPSSTAIPTTSSTATCSPACTATTWGRHPRAGMDPDNLPESDPEQDEFSAATASQGLEGHLGLRPGHRRDQASGCTCA